MKRTLLIIAITAVAATFAGGCSRAFTAVAPEGFATYKGGESFRAVSPGHIVYRVRTVANDPYAGFDFWREALPERMKNAGYRIIADSVVVCAKDKALLLEMAAPVEQSDYTYLVMMMVGEKRILIAEAAGEFTEVQGRKTEIVGALLKNLLK